MVLAFMVFVATSCHDAPIGDSFADDLYVPIGALVSVSNVQTGFFDLGDPDNASIAFDLSSTGESLSAADVEMSFNGGTPVPFKSGAAVPGTVSVTFNEALAAAGKSVAEVEVGDEFRFEFVSTSSSGTFRSSNTLVAAISCRSELVGTYDYVSSNYFCTGDDLTGQVTITEINAGEYALDDWAFGTYPICYGGTAASWGTLVLKDVCNKISVGGEDNYGDTWEWTINDVSGPTLSITWTMTYGEFGDVTLTRTDGSDWPPLSN